MIITIFANFETNTWGAVQMCKEVNEGMSIMGVGFLRGGVPGRCNFFIVYLNSYNYQHYCFLLGKNVRG